MADLLDLYNGHRMATSVGPMYPLDTFIRVRITLNHEKTSKSLPRYTLWDSEDATRSAVTSPADPERRNANGSALTYKTNGSIITPTSISPQSPAPGAGTVGERGKDGTVRFMLDPVRAQQERDIVRDYFKPKEIEEYVYE